MSEGSSNAKTKKHAPMDEQIKHYQSKLAFETDSWDLKGVLESGEAVLVIDTRSPEAYHKEHIPGAINIPHPWIAA